MRQRIPARAWRPSSRPGHRPRLLIEDDHPALAVSDFTLFEKAGLNVAYCSGPGLDRSACPLLRGEACPLVSGADVVLHGLSPALGIAGAIRQRHPHLPVVIEERPGPDGKLPPPPGDCLTLVSPSSVQGQIDAVWRALAD
jgi:hypothetical protein